MSRTLSSDSRQQMRSLYSPLYENRFFVINKKTEIFYHMRPFFVSMDTERSHDLGEILLTAHIL